MSEIILSDDKTQLQVARIHGWLASSYWSPGIALSLVEKAIAGRIAWAPIGRASRSVMHG